MDRTDLILIVIALHLAAAAGFLVTGDPTTLATIAQIDAAALLYWLSQRQGNNTP